MPIDINTFDRADGDDLGKPTNAERVLGFLVANDGQAFTPAEVAEGTEVKRSSIGTVLRRLKQRDLVRHKGEYWAAGAKDRIRDAYDLHQTLAALDEQLGAEDLDEWATHAADRD